MPARGVFILVLWQHYDMIRELTIYRLRSFHDEMIILLAYSIQHFEKWACAEPWNCPFNETWFRTKQSCFLSKKAKKDTRAHFFVIKMQKKKETYKVFHSLGQKILLVHFSLVVASFNAAQSRIKFPSPHSNETSGLRRLQFPRVTQQNINIKITHL